MSEVEQLREAVEALGQELAEFRQHGSRNFRNYRRRATAAFVGLALAMAGMGYWIWTVGQDNNQQLALAGADATYKSCQSGNEVRGGVLGFLEYLAARAPKRNAAALARARQTFGPRDCAAAAAALQKQAD